MKIKIEKLEKTKKEYVRINGENVEVKPFLSMNEISTIITQMVENKNVVERNIVKDLAVLKYCTDIENLQDIDFEILYEQNIIQDIVAKVTNYNMIDELFKETQTIGNMFNRISTTIETFVDRFTSLDVGEATNQLEEILAKINQGDEDIASIVNKAVPKIVQEVTGK